MEKGVCGKVEGMWKSWVYMWKSGGIYVEKIGKVCGKLKRYVEKVKGICG